MICLKKSQLMIVPLITWHPYTCWPTYETWYRLPYDHSSSLTCGSFLRIWQNPWLNSFSLLLVFLQYLSPVILPARDIALRTLWWCSAWITLTLLYPLFSTNAQKWWECTFESNGHLQFYPCPQHKPLCALIGKWDDLACDFFLKCPAPSEPYLLWLILL